MDQKQAAKKLAVVKKAFESLEDMVNDLKKVPDKPDAKTHTPEDQKEIDAFASSARLVLKTAVLANLKPLAKEGWVPGLHQKDAKSHLDNVTKPATLQKFKKKVFSRQMGQWAKIMTPKEMHDILDKKSPWSL